jgi:hypothetical protein
MLRRINVATLALGSGSKQGVARLRAKRETWESLHMLPRVQRVWGNEPSYSKVNSHVGNWSFERTPESLERNFRGQNSSPWRVLYIIEKILKCRCLKWARIAHLDICNTSYGQKKGRESNWQFDSQPLKVQNWPDFLACRQRVTYRWKDLDELKLCFRLHCDRRFSQEVMRPQSCGSPGWWNFGTPIWESRDKKPFGCGPCGKA